MATFEVHTAEQLLNDSINYLIANPNSSGPWNLNQGSRVRTILEAVALSQALTSSDFYLSLTAAIFESVMKSFGFDKMPAVNSTGYVTFTRYLNVGVVTIPAGTKILSENGIVVYTAAVSSILNGNYSSVPVLCYSQDTGAITNIIARDIDTLNGRGNIVDVISGVDNAVNLTSFTGGEDEETDAEQLYRFRQGIQGLTKSTLSGLLRGALSVTGVKSATIVENYPEPGIVTVLADDGAGTLSPAIKAEIEKVLNGDPNDLTNYPGYRAAGIGLNVEAPAIIVVDMDITINVLKHDRIISDSELINIVQSAVESYINGLGIGQDVILTEVITACQNSHSSVYDVIITDPLTNIAIEGFYKARTGSGVGGSITITINEVADA